jgi:hypothetical protein
MISSPLSKVDVIEFFLDDSTRRRAHQAPACCGGAEGSPSKICLKLVEVPGLWILLTLEHRGAPVCEPATA